MNYIKVSSTILLSLVTASTSLKAQTTLKVDCETGTRAKDLANCWSFPRVTYSKENSISGTYSAKTEALTDLNDAPAGIISPWTKFDGTGTIDMAMKLDSWGGAKSRKFTMLKEDANKLGILDTLYNYEFTEATATAMQKPSVNINFSGIYRLHMYFSGDKGTSKAIFDDLSIAGKHFASPSHGCAIVASGKDSDGDGVTDDKDEFPNDPARAYTFSYPPAGPGTMMFEDTWPKVGDYDLNDLVVDYQYVASLNAANNIVDITLNYTTRAIGGVYHNGLMLQADNLPAEYIESVKGGNNSGAKWIDLAANGTENDQKFANILIFDDAYNLFPAQGSGIINTDPKKPYLPPVTTSIVITFSSKAGAEVNLDKLTFNPYLVLGQERGNELHLVDHLPTGKANTKLFGTGDDATNLDKGIYYRTKTNLPYAIAVDNESIPYMREQVDFVKGYPNIANWAQSNGATNNDWYTADDKNRNTDALYGK